MASDKHQNGASDPIADGSPNGPTDKIARNASGPTPMFPGTPLRDVQLRSCEGCLYMADSEYDLAAQAFRDVVTAKPDWAAAQLQFANAIAGAVLSWGNSRYQLDYISVEAIRRHYEEPKPDREPMGRNFDDRIAYFKLGRRMDSVARKLHARPPDPHYTFRCRRGSGRWRRRHLIPAYMTAVTLDPGNAQARVRFGNALIGLAKRREALEQYQAAVRVAPDYSAAHVCLAFAFEVLHGQDEAVAALEAAISVDPRDVYAYRYMGRIYRAAGRGKEAVAAYRAAVQHGPPNDPEGYRLLAELCAELYQGEEALAACRAAVECDPENPYLHRLLGDYLLESELYDEAIDAYLVAIGLKPDYQVAVVSLAYALYKMKRYQEAGVACEETIRLPPRVQHCVAVNVAYRLLARIRQGLSAEGL